MKTVAITLYRRAFVDRNKGWEWFYTYTKFKTVNFEEEALHAAAGLVEAGFDVQITQEQV